MSDNETTSPYAQAAAWIGRIVAMAVVMVAPILLGQKLDARFESGFFGLIGIVVGVSVGFLYLLLITGVLRRGRRGALQKDDQTSPEHPND